MYIYIYRLYKYYYLLHVYINNKVHVCVRSLVLTASIYHISWIDAPSNILKDTAAVASTGNFPKFTSTLFVGAFPHPFETYWYGSRIKAKLA